MIKKKLLSINWILYIAFLLIHVACLDAGFEQGSEGGVTRINIEFPSEECLEQAFEPDASSQQTIFDCVAFYTLTVTGPFDPIEATFDAEEGGTRVFVPIGPDRNFMIVGRHENGEECCSIGFTGTVYAGGNEFTSPPCIPVPTPTPTPIPTPTPTPIPTPTPTPVPTPTPTPIPTPTPTPTPIACFCEAEGEDCPDGYFCQTFPQSCDGICVPEPTPTPTPTAEPTPIPTPTPTAIPTPSPIPTPIECEPEEDECPEGYFCDDGFCQPIIIERANDGIDNDGDGRIDCADLDSVGQKGFCGEICEQPEMNCTDGFDNDGDGHVDCSDQDCDDDQFCNEIERTLCTGVEGIINCEDPACSQDPICTETGLECSDFEDNDLDGFIDCEDSDCFNFCE